MELSDFERQVLLNLEYYVALKASEHDAARLAWTRSWKREITAEYWQVYGERLAWMRPAELFDRLKEVEGSAAFACVLLKAVLYTPFYPLDGKEVPQPVDEEQRVDFLAGLFKPYVSRETLDGWIDCFKREVVSFYGKVPAKSFQQILMKNWQGDSAALRAALFEARGNKKKATALVNALALTEIREIFLGMYKDYRYCEMLRVKACQEDEVLADAIRVAIDEAM